MTGGVSSIPACGKITRCVGEDVLLQSEGSNGCMIFMTVGCSWCVFSISAFEPYDCRFFQPTYLLLVRCLLGRQISPGIYIIMIVYFHHNILTPDNSYK